MEITVNFYPSHAGSGCELQVRTVVLQEATTIRDLLQELSLKPTDATAIFRNGESALYQEVLHQGDTVTVLPFVSGG